MPQLTTKRIRLAPDSSARTGTFMEEVRSSATPELWRGNDVVFEIGLHFNAALITDISDVASLTLDVKPSKTDRTGAAVMSKTLQAAALDGTITAEQWTAGTHQHAEIPFTAAETNLDPGTDNEEAYWLVISVITTAGKSITLQATILTLVEDGTGTADPPPSLASPYVTLEQVFAIFQQMNPDQSRVRFGDGKNLYLYDDNSGLHKAVIATEKDGVLTFSFAEGETL